jgi:hypothetical protein
MNEAVFETFGSLDLNTDPEEAGPQQAISLSNVALDRMGRLRTRDGYDALYSAGAALAQVVALHPVSAGKVLAAHNGGTVRVVDLTAGTSAANVAGANAPFSFASDGTGVYFTDGTTTQIRKFVAPATFSSPAGLAAYKGNYLAVQPLEDRLVVADATNTSKLWFSDAATPETITASNFVQLTPGDGQDITGMAVFGTDLYVFKKTKFFVFSGNGIDSTGGVIFNYRMVDTGVGCHVFSPSYKATAVHETGLYFVGSDGVYRTTGGAPVKVSQAISPAFDGADTPVPAPFSSVQASPWNAWQITVARDKLYLTGVGLNLTYVMDIMTGRWTVYSWGMSVVLDGDLIADSVTNAAYSGSAIAGGQQSGLDVIARHSSDFTTDDGTAIVWHWQSGFYDLGTPTSKRVGPLTLWGSGTVTASVFADYGTTDANAGSVTLGTSPVVARGRHLKTYRGRLFSHKVSGSGSAVVHQAALTVRDQRVQ